MRGTASGLTRPQVFDGLTLAGVGPLAFQGLSSAAAVSPDDRRLAQGVAAGTVHVG